jgi:hypothetical protein
MVHYDTDLYDLMVKTARDTEVIDTTSNHLFWDRPRASGSRPPASSMASTSSPPTAPQQSPTAATSQPCHDGWMWDLTIQNDHDFYVQPGEGHGVGKLVLCGRVSQRMHECLI